MDYVVTRASKYMYSAYKLMKKVAEAQISLVMTVEKSMAFIAYSTTI